MDTIPITPSQIRAARALLDLSQEDAAKLANVSLTTLRDVEGERRGGSIVSIKSIRDALMNAGVIFLPNDGRGGPGVRVIPRLPSVLRWPTKLGRFDELSIPVEWRGREYSVLVSQEVLDDLGRITATLDASGYVRLFEEHRTKILQAAAVAIDAGRVTADRRVSLTHDDFPEFRPREPKTSRHHLVPGWTILEEGFLSPDVAYWSVKHRAENSAWVAVAEKLNRIAQSLLATTTLRIASAQDSKLLSMLLFTRSLSNFQATVLLAERGMVVEARLLARACLETTFCLGAMVKAGDEFVNKVLYNELHERRASVNWLLNAKNRRQFLAADDRKRLAKHAEEVERTWKSLAKVGFEEMARLADMEPLYVWYRQLSGDAAHPTVSSLNRYITDNKGDEVSEIRWGPDCNSEELGDTINLACNFLLAACVSFNSVAGNEQINETLVELFREYQKLNGIKTGSAAATNDGSDD